MHRGLVALSASAVAAVYLAGYLRTQPADASIAAASVATPPAATQVVASAAPPPVVVAPAQPRPPLGTAPSGAGAPAGRPNGASAAPTPAIAPAPRQAGTFKDGTFTGQGTSRRGDVWVSVQVTGGRISNVTITRSTLQYPLRDIANLPSEVVQRQSAQVDVVSRATYSSMAFRGAVTQALASAQAG
jgi:uncharacterized protein with FMN-binding domain